MVNLGFAGVYIIVLYLLKNRMWVRVRTASLFLRFDVKHRLWVLVRTAPVQLIVYPCSDVRCRRRCRRSRRRHQLFQTSPLKLLGQSKPNGMWSLLRIYINGPRRPPCPYMVQTFTNLLQNQKTYDLETWHVASRSQALQSLYK